MSKDEKLSIAELQRTVREMDDLESRGLGSGLLSPRILDAGPVLLEIVAAALAYKKAKKAAAKVRYKLFQAYDKEEIRCRDAYAAALAKVRE